MQEQTRQARIEMETQARLDREASDRARRLALEEEERAAEEERRRVVELEMRERGGVARGRGGVGRGRGVPGARGRSECAGWNGWERVGKADTCGFFPSSCERGKTTGRYDDGNDGDGDQETFWDRSEAVVGLVRSRVL